MPWASVSEKPTRVKAENLNGGFRSVGRPSSITPAIVTLEPGRVRVVYWGRAHPRSGCARSGGSRAGRRTIRFGEGGRPAAPRDRLEGEEAPARAARSGDARAARQWRAGARGRRHVELLPRWRASRARERGADPDPGPRRRRDEAGRGD